MTERYSQGLVPSFAYVEEAQEEMVGDGQWKAKWKREEVCRVRYSGDPNRLSVFPAHAYAGYYEQVPGGEDVAMTYAERFRETYQQFKANEAQTVTGTPVEELKNITPQEKSMLKAMNVYTLEQLASLTGQLLKNLGIGGRDLVDRAAQQVASQSDPGQAAKDQQIAEMAEELAKLREQVASAAVKPKEDTKAFDKPLEDDGTSAGSGYEALSVDELKDLIEDKSGQRPRGNPSKATLVRMAEEAARPDGNAGQ